MAWGGGGVREWIPELQTKIPARLSLGSAHASRSPNTRLDIFLYIQFQQICMRAPTSSPPDTLCFPLQKQNEVVRAWLCVQINHSWFAPEWQDREPEGREQEGLRAICCFSVCPPLGSLSCPQEEGNLLAEAGIGQRVVPHRRNQILRTNCDSIPHPSPLKFLSSSFKEGGGGNLDVLRNARLVASFGLCNNNF
ncbi:UNVERIFIED_CONTAM: hypothetical protein K2H54_024563 [Gekko kuhli]